MRVTAAYIFYQVYTWHQKNLEQEPDKKSSKNHSFFLVTLCNKKRDKHFCARDGCIVVLKHENSTTFTTHLIILVFLINHVGKCYYEGSNINYWGNIGDINLLLNNFEFKWMNLPCYSRHCSGIGLLDDLFYHK